MRVRILFQCFVYILFYAGLDLFCIYSHGIVRIFSHGIVRIFSHGIVWIDSNVKTISIRPHGIFGPRDPQTIPSIVKVAREGTSYPHSIVSQSFYFTLSRS